MLVKYASSSPAHFSNPSKSACASSGDMMSLSVQGASAQEQHQKRHQEEMNSILDMLDQLQQSFSTHNDDYYSASTSSSSSSFSNHIINSSSNNTEPLPQKEFAIRHYPNGNLFSGSVDMKTKELVYGRMTYALDMEIYEGPFWKGKRHGPGAVCCKMDGSAKFLGR